MAFRPNRNDFYEIWNIDAPNFFLNPEDEHIFQQEIRSKVVILGFIVALEKRTAVRSGFVDLIPSFIKTNCLFD